MLISCCHQLVLDNTAKEDTSSDRGRMRAAWSHGVWEEALTVHMPRTEKNSGTAITTMTTLGVLWEDGRTV